MDGNHISELSEFDDLAVVPLPLEASTSSIVGEVVEELVVPNVDELRRKDLCLEGSPPTQTNLSQYAEEPNSSSSIHTTDFFDLKVAKLTYQSFETIEI